MTIPRPQFLPDGVDPTMFDADKLGVKQAAGCWKWLAIAALPLGLCIGGGGVAFMAVRNVPTVTTPTAIVTVVTVKSGTPLPTPTKTPSPLPVTATPANVPVTTPIPAATQCYLYYRVRPGQTLSAISKLWNLPITQITALNPQIKGKAYLIANTYLKLPFCLPTATPEG